MPSEVPVWTSAHLFRHDDLDQLLTTLVRPLVRELEATGVLRGFFFLRYWEGGPHLRVRLLTDSRDTDAVRRQLTVRFRDHVRLHPRTSRIDQAAYAAVAARTAAFEGRDTYERVLRAGDTLSFTAYHPEHESFGHGPSLSGVEHHFRESAEVVLSCLDSDPAHLQSTALVMTLAAAICLPAGSLRPSTGVPRTSGARAPESFDHAAAENIWARTGDELCAMADRLREAAEHPTEPRGPVLDWLTSFRTLRDRLTTLGSQGLFDSRSPDAVRHALDRCLHLHLNRMGIPPSQEARLRHLAIRAARST